MFIRFICVSMRKRAMVMFIAIRNCGEYPSHDYYYTRKGYKGLNDAIITDTCKSVTRTLGQGLQFNNVSVTAKGELPSLINPAREVRARFKRSVLKAIYLSPISFSNEITTITVSLLRRDTRRDTLIEISELQKKTIYL